MIVVMMMTMIIVVMIMMAMMLVVIMMVVTMMMVMMMVVTMMMLVAMIVMILLTYRIYLITRPGHLFNFWTFRVGANSRWMLIKFKPFFFCN